MRLMAIMPIFPDRNKTQQPPLTKRKTTSGFSEVLDAALDAAEQKDGSLPLMRPPRRLR